MNYRIFFIVFTILFGCKTKSSFIVEYYITPRNVDYGYYDNGVFQYKLEKESIRVPNEHRTYQVNIRKDSIYELYYFQTKMQGNLIKEVDQFKDIGVDSIWKPRMLIIVNSNNSYDTLFIDTNLNGRLNNHGYKLNPEFIDRLFNIMPEELKESWEKNLPPRG